MQKSKTGNASALAIDLSVALSRLRSRVRDEASESSTGVTISQIATLQSLVTIGPMTAAELAAAEHVSKQAMAQRLSMMDALDLIESRRDETDGRKVVVSISDGGITLLRELAESRSAWLVRAIEGALEPEELPVLRDAIELLERLAAVDLSPEFEIK
jgi:DNA-binding MarR family transcriptional regulator